MRLYLLTNLPVRSPSDDLTGCLGDDSETVLAYLPSCQES